MGEAIHGSSNFHINVSVFDFVVKVILVNYVVWDGLDWNSHVFIPVERGGEVEQFEICGDITGVGSADDAVPEYL